VLAENRWPSKNGCKQLQLLNIGVLILKTRMLAIFGQISLKQEYNLIEIVEMIGLIFQIKDDILGIDSNSGVS
jgi:geranylgeranyl pyrophosphate synthase